MDNIKYIIFDLSEVILKGIQETGILLGKIHNIDYTNDPRAKIFSESFPNPHPLLVPLIQDFFIGKINEEEYLTEVITTYPELGAIDDLKKYIRRNFLEIEGTRDIIFKLRSIGYKIGLLSVHGREWIEYCEKKFDFHKMFDAIAYSYEDRVSKPDKKAFIFIVDRLGAEPEECLFIDDSERNVKAAEELGMKGIIFTSVQELRSILIEHLPNYN